MTLNGVMAVTLRYFTEFGKLALQKTICGGIYARVYCIFSACRRRLDFTRSTCSRAKRYYDSVGHEITMVGGTLSLSSSATDV